MYSIHCSRGNQDMSQDVVHAMVGPGQYHLLGPVGWHLIERVWCRVEVSLDEEECMSRMVQYSQVLLARPELWLGSLGACVGSAHHLVVQSSSDLVACARDMLGRAMGLGHCRSLRGGHVYAQGGRDVGRKPKCSAFNRDDPIGAPVPSKTSHGMATAPCTQVCPCAWGMRAGTKTAESGDSDDRAAAGGGWSMVVGSAQRRTVEITCTVLSSRSGIPIDRQLISSPTTAAENI